MRAILLFIVACLPLSATAADWLQFRGPGGQGVAQEKGLPVKWGSAENIVWKTELPGAGTSSPIFWKDRIYLTAYSGFNVPGESGDMQDLKRHLVALDRKSGKVLWTKDVPSKLPEQGRIRDDHGYASSTLACDGERLYAFFGKSGAFAFDRDGKQLWQADVGDDLHPWGSSNSPVLYKDLVFINASIESQTLVALNKKTGKEVWTARDIKESWNTPLLTKNAQGKDELVVAVFGKVLSFDPLKGSPLWSCDTDIGWYMVPSLVSEKDVVYCIGGRSGGGLAVRTGGSGEVTGTHRLWAGKKGSNVSSPIIHEGHLYFAHEGLGIVYCADAKTGAILYEERLPRAGQFYSSPLLADGKLYYVNRTGRTYVVAAKPEFELLATNDLGERSTFNACPVAADGRLFLRSDKHLYCIDE